MILTRTEVIDVRELLTVAELTTSIRGLAVEVPVDKDEAGVSEASVVNCDGIYTVRRSMLSNRVGKLSDRTMLSVCRSLTYALGWLDQNRTTRPPQHTPERRGSRRVVGQFVPEASQPLMTSGRGVVVPL